MVGKTWRAIWWILFPPIGFWLTHRHKRRVREQVEAERHAQLVEARAWDEALRNASDRG